MNQETGRTEPGSIGATDAMLGSCTCTFAIALVQYSYDRPRVTVACTIGQLGESRYYCLSPVHAMDHESWTMDHGP